MSNLSQQISQADQATITTLTNQIANLEQLEINVTPNLTYTDAELFQYGISITETKVLQDQANMAVDQYTLPPDAASIAALQVRLTAVEAVYVATMVARAPSLFT